MDIEALKSVLHHLLRMNPISEADQKRLHQVVDNLHLSAEEKQVIEDEAMTGVAPPGWSQVDGKWTQTA